MSRELRWLKVICVVGLVAICWVGCEKQSITSPEEERQAELTTSEDQQENPAIVQGNVRLPGEKSSAGIMVYASGTSLLCFTDENGDFSFKDVPPGEYEFFAYKPGYESQSLGKITVEAGGTFTLETAVLQELPISEERVGTIIGNVELEGTTDFSNVIIEIPDQLIRTVTDESGVYIIPNLTPGVYNVVFKKQGYRTEQITVDVKSGLRPTLVPSVKLLLTAKRSGVRTIYGTVEMFDSRGNPANKFSSVVVALEGTSYVAVPDATGRFTFKELPPGKYTITSSAPGFRNRNKIDVDLVSLPYTHVTLVLDEDTTEKKQVGSIHGSVHLSDDENHSGITVGLMGTSFVALTNEKGEYTISNVPEGSYSLIAELSGYIPVKLEPVSVYPGETTEVEEITLEPYIEPPVVLYTQPSDGAKNISVKREIPVYVWFSKKMHPGSLKKAVSVSPDVDYQIFTGKEHPQSDFDILLIMLKGCYTDNPVKFKTTYKISISTAAKDWEEQHLEEPYEFSFTTGEAEIINTFPRQGEARAYLTPRSTVAIYFNATIDHETLNESNITLSPEPVSALEIYGSDNIDTGWTTARISTTWEPDTDYTLTVGRGVRTADGSYVSNTPYVLRFHTTKLREFRPFRSREE